MYIYIYGVAQVFKQHTAKIIRILNSIENEGQLECAKTIISNFVDYWKFKKADVKEIRNNLATFNMIYKLKCINRIVASIATQLNIHFNKSTVGILAN